MLFSDKLFMCNIKSLLTISLAYTGHILNSLKEVFTSYFNNIMFTKIY